MKYKAGDIVVYKETEMTEINEGVYVGRLVKSFCFNNWSGEFNCTKANCIKSAIYIFGGTGTAWVCERQIRMATDQEKFLYLLDGREMVKLEETKE